MNTNRMPSFSPEGSLYQSSAYYQIGVMLPGLKQGRRGVIHPVLRPLPYSCFCGKSMKGPFCCCNLGFGTFCVNKDGAMV
jgi:hypothetical protein